MVDNATRKSGEAAEPVLLSGGNPQIAKADGDAPVQAYIAAMPGWKSDVGRRLDSIIVRTVPDVRKAVRWNSPFYGMQGQGWFLNFHCFTKYVKVAFFNGASLDPHSTRRVQRRERPLSQHLSRRPIRRGAVRCMGDTGKPIARLGHVRDEASHPRCLAVTPHNGVKSDGAPRRVESKRNDGVRRAAAHAEER